MIEYFSSGKAMGGIPNQHSAQTVLYCNTQTDGQTDKPVHNALFTLCGCPTGIGLTGVARRGLRFHKIEKKQWKTRKQS